MINGVLPTKSGRAFVQHVLMINGVLPTKSGRAFVQQMLCVDPFWVKGTSRRCDSALGISLDYFLYRHPCVVRVCG
jgi:hypothetical protein